MSPTIQLRRLAPSSWTSLSARVGDAAGRGRLFPSLSSSRGRWELEKNGRFAVCSVGCRQFITECSSGSSVLPRVPVRSQVFRRCLCCVRPSPALTSWQHVLTFGFGFGPGFVPRSRPSRVAGEGSNRRYATCSCGSCSTMVKETLLLPFVDDNSRQRQLPVGRAHRRRRPPSRQAVPSPCAGSSPSRPLHVVQRWRSLVLRRRVRPGVVPFHT